MKTNPAAKEQHIDGEWMTSWYNHNGIKFCIKSREGKGMKAHAFDENDKVLFTLRYYFIPKQELVNRMIKKLTY